MDTKIERYVIGAVFTPDFEHVLLINKLKPDWQNGKVNFPGGRIEARELPVAAASREFNEECTLLIPESDWYFIGEIVSVCYRCKLLTAIYREPRHGRPLSSTDETVFWCPVSDLPTNVITNLHWLVPYAKHFYSQNTPDTLYFSEFYYR